MAEESQPRYFLTYISPAPLAVFRMAFGVLILASVVRFWAKGWIAELYIQPKFFFPYYGLDFIRPLGSYTYALFAVCGGCALLVALGWHYRPAAAGLSLEAMYVVVSPAPSLNSSESPGRNPAQGSDRGSAVALTPLDAAGLPQGSVEMVSFEALAAAVGDREAATHPRWVWDDTAHWYPPLLAAGVRIDRAVDLRLSHAILRRSALTRDSALAAAAPNAWDAPRALPARRRQETTLFDFDEGPVPESGELDSLGEFRLQRAAITASADPSRLGLLLAAESAGGLIAAEMQFAGLPYNAQRHDELLTSVLGD